MRIPGATYRLQFNGNFTFEDARQLAAYLQELGITDLYASPIFTAPPTSNHGYDVCDYNQINPVLGGSAGWLALTNELRERGMGLLLDFVPNHMGAVPGLNHWWRDVLEHGQNSRYAKFFDVDWEACNGRILLPILGGELPAILDQGLIRLSCQEDRLGLQYGETVLPLTPASEQWVRKSLRFDTEPARNATVATFNETLKNPESRDWMRELLAKQVYLLEYWRTGTRRANYRRFFDVDGLVGINVDLPEVFEAVHRLLGDLVKAGQITGLRLDHIDGLADPAGYLERLQSFLKESNREQGGFYVLVEKILMGSEELREEWPVSGTTGYEFGAAVSGLLVEGASEEKFSHLYETFVGDKTTLGTVIVRSKRQVMGMALSKEVGILTRLLKESAGDGFSVDDLRAAVEAVLASFPVYRTYTTPKAPAGGLNRAVVETALELARIWSPHVKAKAFELLRQLLLAEAGVALSEAGQLFRQRFQQFSGPIMAKSVEDTAFFVFNRLIALNEVGADPGRWGLEPAAFHAMNARRSHHEPHAMLTTSTHDTKLSEDARARVAAISELGEQWEDFLKAAAKINEALKVDVRGKMAPDRNEEYFFYQIVLASWPLEPLDAEARRNYEARAQAHMRKALREAKINTRWDEPNPEWEAATSRFVWRIINEPSREFVEKFEALAERVAELGAMNSLAQTLLKLTSPGVPDVYQGNESWEFALTDPDNRRPVDFEFRRRLLKSLYGQQPADLLANWRNGAIKLFLTRTVLRFRREHSRLFEAGDYVPLTFEGKFAQNCLGFARRSGDEIAVVITSRLTGKVGRPPVGECWGSTTADLTKLETGAFTDLFTGREIDGSNPAMSEVFAQLPFAVLVGGKS
jgi:(1->4)-alpha-D-glucan 1-alpha-D-glucosylmutase